MRSRNTVGPLFAYVISLGVLVMLHAAAATAQQADVIFHNGNVLTVDENFSTAEAVAIDGNQILSVGTNEAVLTSRGPDTLVVDLQGRTLIPGLIDTHTHVHNYAESVYGVDMTPEESHRYPIDWRGVRSKDDVLSQIRGTMDKYDFEPGKWIYFQNKLSFSGTGGSPDQAKILYDDMSRYDLDKVAPDNPIALSLGIPDFNGFLLNSNAVDVIWNKEGYADFIVKYGLYWLDGGGQPDGHVEPPASRIVNPYTLDRDPAVLAPIYKKYNDELAATGVTTISGRIPQEALKAYQLLDSTREMTFRMAYGREEVFGTLKNPAEDLKAFQGLVGTGGDMFWITSVAPTAVDGAGTRACTNLQRKESYGAVDGWWPLGQCHTDGEFTGAARRSASISGNYFRDWTVNQGLLGIRFANTHVAGDRSVANLLAMVEDIQEQSGTEATKDWNFDHCFMVNVKDLPNAARLGIGFSCAPKYVQGAAGVARAYGEDIAHTFMVPVKSMLDNNVHVVFESDRDIYAWHDLEILLNRKDRNGKVWGAHEAVDKATALKMITRWAAEYVLKGDKLGSIEKGKLADLVVLDRNYMTIPDDDVSELRPQLTMLDGRIIFVHSGFATENNLQPAGAIVSTYEELRARRPGSERSDF
jgi:predicted amidohydrolase YtcJ